METIVGFTLLEADQGEKLHPSKNQEPNGEYMIVDARRRCGPIYLRPTLVSLSLTKRFFFAPALCLS